MVIPFVVVVVTCAASLGGYLGLLVSPCTAKLSGTAPQNRARHVPPSRASYQPPPHVHLGGVRRVRLRPWQRLRACVLRADRGLLRETIGPRSIPLVVLSTTTVPEVIAGWLAC